MARTSRKVWEKRVERLRDSELTDVEFAAEIGVNVHTLRSWKWKLAAERRAQGGTPKARPARSRPTATRKGAAPKPTFVELELAPAEPIELRVGDIEVRVPIGFDEATLTRVVAVLRQAA
jgi:hypothetical protein